MNVVVGLDLSLTSTGIAVVRDRFVSECITIGSKGAKDASLSDRHRRLHRLRRDIWDLAKSADLVVVEGPSYGQARQGGQHDRAGLWWLIVDWLLAGVDLAGNPWPAPAVVEVPPSVRAKYATGKGNAPKDAVLASVVRRFPNVAIESNDQADALVLAAMGQRAIGEPIDDMPKNHVEAMDKVRWPEFAR